MNQYHSGKMQKNSQGFSLIEVLLAVAIMSFGLLALAAMQLALIRGSADTNAQSVAINLAEQRLEQIRSFQARDDDTGSTTDTSYQAIADATDPNITIGNVTYRRTVAVTRFVYGTTSFALNATDNGLPTGVPEFKNIGVTVAWDDSTGATQSVRLADLVSVSSPTDSALALRNPTLNRIKPGVRLKPTDPSLTSPGVISMVVATDSNNNAISAASSNPIPETFSDQGRVTTRYSVQSYLSDDPNAPLLLTRSEFAITSCSCTLSSTTSTAASPAYEPTYWDGEKFTTPKPVAGKVIGTADSSADQDDLCVTCCRDHHDSTTSQAKFDPYRPSTDYNGTSGDHNHYANVLGGSTTPVTAGQRYDEVCRLVRVDGVLSVANDTRLENFNLVRTIPGATPSSTPILSSAVKTAYSNFASAYLNQFASTITAPLAGYPATRAPNLVYATYPTPSTLGAAHEGILDIASPTDNVSLAAGTNTSFNVRGLFIDYLNPQIIAALNCIGNTATACSTYRTKSKLQILPFTDINITYLANWPAPSDGKVQLSNAPIPLNTTYDYFATGYNYNRGKATGLSATPVGTPSIALPDTFRGNSALVDSRSVPATDPDDASPLSSDQEEIDVTSSVVVPPNLTNVSVLVTDASANLTNFDEANVSVKIVSPLDISADDTCDTTSVPSTPANSRKFSGCTIPTQSGTASITIRVTNYNRGPLCSGSNFNLEGGGPTGTDRCPINSNPPITTGVTCVKRTGAGNINATSMPILRDYEVIVGSLTGGITATVPVEGTDIGFAGETSDITFTGPWSSLETMFATGLPLTFREDTTKFCSNANP